VTTIGPVVGDKVIPGRATTPLGAAGGGMGTVVVVEVDVDVDVEVEVVLVDVEVEVLDDVEVLVDVDVVSFGPSGNWIVRNAWSPVFDALFDDTRI
jgi:hypothetical protein